MIRCYLRRVLLAGGALAVLVPMVLRPPAPAHAQGTEVCGEVAADTTWGPEGSPYRVTCDVEVLTDATLTVPAGVEVRFDEATALKISGSLAVTGSDPVDVLFTTSQSPAARGAWRGLEIRSGGTATIAGLTLQYAGARSDPAVDVSADGVTIASSIIEESADTGISFNRVSGAVSATVIRNNAKNGIEASASSGERPVLELTGNTFDGNSIAVEIDANVQTVMSSNSAEDNGRNAVVITGSTIDVETTFYGGDLPYFLDRPLTVKTLLTIEADTFIKSFIGRGISVSSGGRLVARGTTAKPIVITSLADDTCADTEGRVDCDTGNDRGATEPGRGDWGIVSLKGARSALENVELRYGKDNMVTVSAPGVAITSTLITMGAGDAVLVDRQSTTITGSRMIDNNGDGVAISASGPITVTVQDNVFEKNRAVVATPADVILVTGGNKVSGPEVTNDFSNALNGYVVSGDMTTRRSWSAGDLPYVVDGTFTLSRPAAELTLEPGLLVKMTDDGWIRVTRGQLRIGALEGDPVLITSVLDDACSVDEDTGCDTNGDGNQTVPVPGSWKAVDIEKEGRGAFIRNAVIRYGGQTRHEVKLEHPQSVVDGAVVAYSGGVGMTVGEVNSTIIEGNTFEANQGHGLEIASDTGGSTVTLRRNKFLDNEDPDASDMAAAVAIDANVQLEFDDSNTASGNELNGIAIVDGDVTTSRMLSPSKLPFLILDDILVKDGATLTVNPGTILKFARDQELRADRSGAVVVVGTAGEPVILTSLADDSAGGDSNPGQGARSPNAGDWTGIAFKSNSKGGRIENASIRFAGGNGDEAVRISIAGVSLRDSEITDSGETAIFLDDVPRGTSEVVEILNNRLARINGDGVRATAREGATQPDIRDNEVEGARFAFSVDANVAPRLGGNVATDNLVNGIAVNGTLNIRRTWAAGELPWVLDGAVEVSSSGWLEIEDGAVIKARPDGELSVSRGRLIVPKAGGGDKPVIFTSVRDDTACAAPGVCDSTSDDTPAARGDWAGITILRTADPVTLRNVRLLYAGGDDHALLLDASGSTLTDSEIALSGSDGLAINRGRDILVTNNVFRRNNGVGINLDQEAGGTFTGNILTQNIRSFVHESTNPTVTGDNVAVGNEHDAMLYCADVSVDTVWRNDLPREIKTNCGVEVDSGTLTIEPGSLLEYARGAAMTVRSRLEAEGVVMAASSPEAPPGSWKGVTFGRQSQGLSRHNLFIAAGSSSRGALHIENSAVVALYNTILRMDRTGVSVAEGADPEIRGNLIRDIVGTNSAAVRISDENSDPEVSNNLLTSADFGVYTSRGQPKVHGNDLSNILRGGVENRTRSNCINAQGNWWGDPSGPRDTTDEGTDCGPGLNEDGRGVPAGRYVDYANWLTSKPPAAPVMDLPMCGVTNQRDQAVSGRSSPGAEIHIFDGDRDIGQIQAGSDGRFDTTVQLGRGAHRISFEARSQAGATTLVSPRTGFRPIEVDDTITIDPAGIRFEYGPPRSRRMQPLRSAAGCATGCGGRTSGRVELPPNEAVVVSAPIDGRPSSVEFVQDGADPQPMTDRGGGVWATGEFVPVQGSFKLRVNGATPVECFGYVYPGGGGFVFSDTGSTGDPIQTEDFEGAAQGWRPEPPWGITDEAAHGPGHSITDSPGGNYNNNTDTSVYLPGPVDLSDVASPQITFWHKFRFARRDYGYFEARLANSSTWKRLVRYEGVTAGWTDTSISLDDYAEETKVFFRFRIKSNDKDTDDGWHIDDVVIGPGGRLNRRYDRGEPVIEGMEVLLEQRNLVLGSWEEWNPLPTGQSNPQVTDAAGRYGFYNLPPGEYRIRVGSIARSPVLAVWNGTFEYRMPVAGTQPIFLPVVANKDRITE